MIRNLKFFYILLAFCLCISGCELSHEIDNEQNSSKNQISAGDMYPGRIDQQDSNYVFVAFMQSARVFRLDAKMSQSREFLELLKKAHNDLTLVSVSTFNGTSDISDIKLSSQEISDSFRESSVHMDDPRSLNRTLELPIHTILPNIAMLDSMFKKMNSPLIPFSFAVDGCYARAHKMRAILNQYGHECEKLFAFADDGFLSTNTPSGCCVWWSWHVAPLVWYKDSQGVTQQAIIDPSLFTGPVSVAVWKARLMTGLCSPYGPSSPRYPTQVRYEQMPGDIYMYWGLHDVGTNPYGGTWATDNTLGKTNCINNLYSAYSGCTFPANLSIDNCFPPNQPVD